MGDLTANLSDDKRPAAKTATTHVATIVSSASSGMGDSSNSLPSNSPMALLALGLSSALFKRLEKLRVKTLDDLLALSARDLLISGHFTLAQVTRMSEFLAMNGYQLLDDASGLSGVPVESSPENPKNETPPGHTTPAAQSAVSFGAADVTEAIRLSHAAQHFQQDILQRASDNVAVIDEPQPRQTNGKRGRPRLTDSERSRRKAAKASTFPRRVTSPRLNNPQDRQRIEDLRESVTMHVSDAAWLYGVSRDVVYRNCAKGTMAHRRFGDRVVVVTQAVFSELFPAGIGTELGSTSTAGTRVPNHS